MEQPNDEKKDITETVETPKKLPLKLIIIGASTLAIIIIGILIWLLFIKGHSKEETKNPHATEKEEGSEQHKEKKEGVEGEEGEGEGKEKEKKEEGKKEGGEKGKEGEVKIIVDPFPLIYKMGDFAVNIQDPMLKRHLKTQIALELFKETLKNEIKDRFPEIRDVILLFLSTKKWSDIESIEGKLELKDE
ncbi:MAG: flagellar basal body-associated FliL family protein, partial [Desulfobacterales bacterium]|nr:flagellar basal body-associated FliL family protein [Desulfobacterales bacterium]